MDSDNSIMVNNVSKSFKIHHEKKNSLYEYLTSIFERKKTFENIIVLKNISFSVKKGEMLGIIGFNGSGKTTLLKIIGKIYSPDQGKVTTSGKLIPFLELGTGFNGELTARDNIIIYGVILGFTQRQIKEKIDEIIKFAEIERFLDTKLKNFSAGMNARLAFSTAMQVDPDIMLVDEALSVGDILFQEKSFKAFMEFKKAGKTIVYVSHNLEQMKDLCDNVLWIHEGTIRDYGESKKVIKAYQEFAESKEK
jgi:lipopolysaccharide transport system ATP-binding protein